MDAWIVPVFKRGDKHKATYYRPVSLSSITCKSLELIIYSNVMAHFDKHHILKDHQPGFSRETQLLTVTIQEIASRLSKGNQVDVILLDFMKAFGKVPFPDFSTSFTSTGLDQQLDTIFPRESQTGSSTGWITLRPVRCPFWGSVLRLSWPYINAMPVFLRLSDCGLFAVVLMTYCVVNKTSDCKLLQQDLTALEQWEVN